MWTANKCTWKDQFEVADIERPGQTMSHIHLLHFTDFWDLHWSRALQTQKYKRTENQTERSIIISLNDLLLLFYLTKCASHWLTKGYKNTLWLSSRPLELFGQIQKNMSCKCQVQSLSIESGPYTCEICWWPMSLYDRNGSACRMLVCYLSLISECDYLIFLKILINQSIKLYL